MVETIVELDIYNIMYKEKTFSVFPVGAFVAPAWRRKKNKTKCRSAESCCSYARHSDSRHGETGRL